MKQKMGTQRDSCDSDDFLTEEAEFTDQLVEIESWEL